MPIVFNLFLIILFFIFSFISDKLCTFLYRQLFCQKHDEEWNGLHFNDILGCWDLKLDHFCVIFFLKIITSSKKDVHLEFYNILYIFPSLRFLGFHIVYSQ